MDAGVDECLGDSRHDRVTRAQEDGVHTYLEQVIEVLLERNPSCVGKRVRICFKVSSHHVGCWPEIAEAHEFGVGLALQRAATTGTSTAASVSRSTSSSLLVPRT